MKINRTTIITRMIVVAAACGITGVALSGCATIMHGAHQDVGISSSPTGASVSIDNVEKGKTPLVASLKRSDNHIVKIELAGYQPFEATITHSVSGWAWGNLVFGGLIGLAVDGISGGIYTLSPEQIAGTLPLAQAANTKDGVYIFAVLSPQRDWVKVAQLQRE
jgi:PEGA domain